jgi:hypothetical protein
MASRAIACADPEVTATIGAPTEERKAMVKTITPEDIRDLLGGFAAAIELDQLRVDALPPEKFHPGYTDSMWRAWRRDHITYINKLPTTVSAIPPAILEELTRIAITCEPAVVGQIAVDLFAEGASGSCRQEELDTAALFFRWLIEQVSDSSEGKPNAAMEPAPQNNQLMLKHRILSLKPHLRLERRAQDGQDETQKPDHSASLR